MRCGMLGLLRHAPARRPLVMAAVALQGGNLVVLGLLTALGVTTPAVLVTVACFHHLFGMPAGTAWSSWFGDLTLTHEDDGTTCLTAAVADQAELHGMLSKIRDLGVTLISLEVVDATTTERAARPTPEAT